MALGPTHSLSNLSLLPWRFGLSGHVKAVVNIRSVFPTLGECQHACQGR